MTNVMSLAWEIAYEGQESFGGKVKEYFAKALKIAWEIIKGENEMNIKTVENFSLPALEGTEKQIKWAEDIRKSAVQNMYLNEVTKEEYVQESKLPMGQDRILKKDVELVVRALMTEKGIEEYINNAFNKDSAIKSLNKAYDRYNRFKEIATNTSAKFWIDNRDNQEKNYMFNAFNEYIKNGTKNF